MSGSPQTPAFDGTLSTVSVSSPSSQPESILTSAGQVDSMVEIKRTPSVSQEALVASGSSEESSEDSKHRLIYSKSKVYVNPTAYARDNIPGFVALVKKVRPSHAPRGMPPMSFGQEAVLPVYLLAWIPETLLDEKGQSEWDKFVKIEEHAVMDVRCSRGGGRRNSIHIVRPAVGDGDGGGHVEDMYLGEAVGREESV